MPSNHKFVDMEHSSPTRPPDPARVAVTLGAWVASMDLVMLTLHEENRPFLPPRSAGNPGSNSDTLPSKFGASSSVP